MNHHYGTYNPAAAAGYQQPHHQQHQPPQPVHAPSQGGHHHPQQQPPPSAASVTTPTLRDVLNGRGQGVQRHPGNVKYRTLVFVNKGLYAKCPRSDKMKISKGVVAAVRELGGRFLELDERSGIYKDIGDKKATEKTSQALREGQTKIRKQMYNDEKNVNGVQTYDTTLLASPAAPTNNGREISAEGYFGYSVQVLESLYVEDESTLHVPHPTGVQPQPIQPQPVPSSGGAFGGSTADNAQAAAIARAMEQFPGSMPPPLPQQPTAASLANNDQTRASELRPSLGRFTNEMGRPSVGRLTNMSMLSVFSLTQLLETARAGSQRSMSGGGRGSIESVLSDEIRDLIRLSEPQLMQVDQMNIDDEIPTHEDKEVSLMFDEDTMKDRVSDLRFTDLSRDLAVDHRFGGGEPNPRLTDSTHSTNYSGTSLMDASMMTIPTDDMSVHPSSDKRKRRSTAAGGNADRETADLLLRLSTDNHGKNH